jgi:L-amino acid N-acyltransferase YncA
MDRPTIRRADPERDAGACAEIYAPHVADGVTSFEEQPPAAEEMAARIEACSAAHAWLVAEADEELVGFAYAHAHRSRPAYRWAADVSVYVAPSSQGRGVGTALYEQLFEELRDRRMRTVCAGVTLPNEASVALHERLGFAPVGIYKAIGWKRGEWRDVGWWQLHLQPPGEGHPAEPR